MSERQPRRHGGPGPVPLTVHLGEKARYQLERVRQLLHASGPSASIPSAGEAIRQAVRRLYQELLFQRADFASLNDSITAEYLKLLAEQQEEEENANG